MDLYLGFVFWREDVWDVSGLFRELGEGESEEFDGESMMKVGGGWNNV